MKRLIFLCVVLSVFCINTEQIRGGEQQEVNDLVRQNVAGYTRMWTLLALIPQEDLLVLANIIAQALPSDALLPGRMMKKNKPALICWFRDYESDFSPAATAVFSAAVTIDPTVFSDVSRANGAVRDAAHATFATAVRTAFAPVLFGQKDNDLPGLGE
ncbi:MAG: hypothetical protein LBJ96_05315 [Holosporaceae bacterium]|jgi:hypothetical protein|nr:hypothetical protein [Holosporaceae bacterium]